MRDFNDHADPLRSSERRPGRRRLIFRSTAFPFSQYSGTGGKYSTAVTVNATLPADARVIRAWLTLQGFFNNASTSVTLWSAASRVNVDGSGEVALATTANGINVTTTPSLISTVAFPIAWDATSLVLPGVHAYACRVSWAQSGSSTSFGLQGNWVLEVIVE